MGRRWSGRIHKPGRVYCRVEYTVGRYTAGKYTLPYCYIVHTVPTIAPSGHA